MDVTGIYKYEEGEDDLMSKEVPRMWSQINWLAAKTIEVCIDENTKQVLVSVPTGQSMDIKSGVSGSVTRQPLFFSAVMSSGWKNLTPAPPRVPDQ